MEANTSDNTKNNHYVPRFCLKNFLDKNGFIHKGILKNKKIYPMNNLKAECSTDNIYTVKSKITAEDFKNFQKFFLSNYQIEADFVSALIAYLNDELGNLIDIKIESNPEAENLANEFKNEINNSDLSRTQEGLFTNIYEGNYLKLYNEILKNKDIAFINQKYDGEFIDYAWIKITYFVYKQIDKKFMNNFIKHHPEENLCEEPENNSHLQDIDDESNDFYNFILFILIQYFRTKKISNALKQNLEAYFPNVDNLYFLFLHIKSIELADILLKDEYKIILLENISDTDFIISDNPCVNLYSTFIKDRLLNDNEIELFLPLSPKLAILFSDKGCYKNLENLKITLNNAVTINKFNKAVIDNADNYIYSCSEELLKTYGFFKA